MALSAQLQMRARQSLVITPQLMQAIRLLQMSSLEIEAYVAEEVEANPLLAPAADNPGGPADGGEPGADATPNGDGETAVDRAGEALAELDARPDDVDPDAMPAPIGRPGEPYSAPAGMPGEAFDPFSGIAAETSLFDHIEAQISAHLKTWHAQCIARHLLADLDPCGYLSTPLEDIAAELGVDRAQVESVLAACRRFEPAGLFARSLNECLAAQLSARDRLDPAMQAMLDHLPLLAEGKLRELRLACGVDEADLADMISELRELDPKPGLAFDRPVAALQIPDVIVTEGDHGWIVELNEDALPRVLIDRTYRAEIVRSDAGDETRRFVSECLQSATWLKKSLDQRATTILKVATAIVEHQAGFLEAGVTGLRPLNLRMIAERIGMHESTVSRATANKSMATPRGVFDLKFFFSAALGDADGGDAHAAEAVKHRIRALIDDEPANAVLSDDRIVSLLGDAGIVIARRTVAKYREMLGIASSVQRRRTKRADPQASPAA